MESFLCTGITLAVFSIEGKTPEEKEILNISDSWLQMSFLSNFNILIGILLGPTDLLESNEDMIFSNSVLSVGLVKKEVSSIFEKIRKKFMWKWNIKLFLPLIEEKLLLKIFEIAIGLEMVAPLTERLLGISTEVFTSYNRFYAFPCIFNAVPVGFKVMIVAVSFALLQNCR